MARVCQSQSKIVVLCTLGTKAVDLSSKVHRRFEDDSAQNQLVAVGLALVDLADCVQLD